MGFLQFDDEQSDLGVNLVCYPLMGRLCHCVSAQMNGPELQTAKTFSFIEVLKPAADDQSIECVAATFVVNSCKSKKAFHRRSMKTLYFTWQ